jgi:hypothetical protein
LKPDGGLTSTTSNMEVGSVELKSPMSITRLVLSQLSVLLSHVRAVAAMFISL